MYYGELCIKVDGKRIVFYTRKRKSKVLPEDEKVCVGSSIEMTFTEDESVKQTLLDVFTTVVRGVCTRIDTGTKEALWKIKKNCYAVVMTGPLIIEIADSKDCATLTVNGFSEECMDSYEIGSLKFSDTGAVSFVQKMLAALNAIGVKKEEAYEYSRSYKEEE